MGRFDRVLRIIDSLVMMNPIIKILVFLPFLIGCNQFGKREVNGSYYPNSWWKEYSSSSAKSWEVLPSQAGPGEVVLSKRNELGILSNFAHTPFTLGSKKYQSVEGFWQMMKFPEGVKDLRSKFIGLEWKHKREEVAQMVAFKAKRAGSAASKNMEKMGINWVTYNGKKIIYRTQKKGKHYDLIRRAMLAKLNQNPKVKEVLLSTGNLILVPDHMQAPDAPPAWKYNAIWMEIRSGLQ